MILQMNLLLIFLLPIPLYSLKVSGIKVHQVPLRQNDNDSPFCYAVSSALDVMGQRNSNSKPINFLASQVWPSARVAASALEAHMDPSWTVCEFGCGPALPSLVAARSGAKKVYATDLDSFALQLVDHASRVQNLEGIVRTKLIDITKPPNFGESDNSIPTADLYIFSDVFESPDVARGAAEASCAILQQVEHSRIWVFAQSDRASREEYLKAMKGFLDDSQLAWAPLEQYDSRRRLCLFDLDETMVSYG